MGVMGQPCGGLTMYFSSSGRTDWTNAWLTSPVLGTIFILVDMEIRRRSSSGERTGAKQSLDDQSCGSRLPRATMRYLARSGLPSSSFLTFERAMVGRALPVTGRRVWYCSSVMYSHV